MIMAALASGASVFKTIWRFRDIPFPWDPAAYACDGLILARDLKAGDLISFAADTYRLGFRPFFHAWMLAPSFILFGNTYASARVVSLFCFVLFLAIVYGIGLEMSPGRAPWVGLLTVCLTLTSIPFLGLSAMCMEEIPGTLMTFATFLVYLRARRDGKSRLFIGTGIFMALTLFTKWHHGVFVIVAIVVTQLTTDRGLLSRRNLSLFGPFLVLIGGWFVYPPHISAFYVHSTFQPQYYTLFSPENLLFYPRSFLDVYHPSILIAIVVGLGFLYSLKSLKDPKARLLAVHVFVGLVLMTIKLDNRHRYIIPIVPSIWLLGARQLVDWAGALGNRLNNPTIKRAVVAGGLVGFLFVSALLVPGIYARYPQAILNYEYACDERQNPAYAFIAQNVGDHRQIVVLGSWDYYNSLKGSTIRWNVEAERDKRQQDIVENKRLARHFFSRLLKNRDEASLVELIRFLEDKDVRVVEGHLLSFMKAIDSRAYHELRAKTALNPFSDKILDVESLPGSASCLITICREGEGEYNHYTQRFMKNQKAWTEGVRRVFGDLGITIAIYEKKTEAGSPPRTAETVPYSGTWLKRPQGFKEMNVPVGGSHSRGTDR